MSQDPKDIFTRISDLDDRIQLARDLVRLRGELLCKAEASDDIIRLQASRIEGTARLLCIQSPGTGLPVTLPALVVVSFSVENDKYFINTSLTAVGGGYYELDFSQDVFHLQRRQSYRIRIPESHKCTYEIGRLNGNPHVLNGALYDVSTGGVRLLFPHTLPVLKIDDDVEGSLNLGQRTPLAFKGKVRHVKPEASRQIVGVEFTDLTPTMENRLFAITMELHRELFNRWS